MFNVFFPFFYSISVKPNPMIRITIASPIHASQQSIAVQSAIQHQATTTTTSLTTLSSGAMMSPQISSPTATMQCCNATTTSTTNYCTSYYYTNINRCCIIAVTCTITNGKHQNNHKIILGFFY